MFLRVHNVENLERIRVHKIIQVQIWSISANVVIYIAIRANPEIHFK